MDEIDYLNQFLKRSMKFGAKKQSEPERPYEAYNGKRVSIYFTQTAKYYDGTVMFSDYHKGSKRIIFEVSYDDGTKDQRAESGIIKGIRKFNSLNPTTANANVLPPSSSEAKGKAPASGNTGPIRGSLPKASGRYNPLSAGPSSSLAKKTKEDIIDELKGVRVLMDHPIYGLKLFGKLENIPTKSGSISKNYRVIWQFQNYGITSNFTMDSIRKGIQNYIDYINYKNREISYGSSFLPYFSMLDGYGNRTSNLNLYNIAYENLGRDPNVLEQITWYIIFRFFILLDTVHDIYGILCKDPVNVNNQFHKENLLIQLSMNYHLEIIHLLNKIYSLQPGILLPGMVTPIPANLIYGNYSTTGMQDYAKWVVENIFPDNAPPFTINRPDTYLDVMYTDILQNRTDHKNLKDLPVKDSSSLEPTRGGVNASGIYLTCGLLKLGIDPTSVNWLETNGRLAEALYTNQYKRSATKTDNINFVVSVDTTPTAAFLGNTVPITQDSNFSTRYISKSNLYDSSGIHSNFMHNGPPNIEYEDPMSNHTFNIYFNFIIPIQVPGVIQNLHFDFANITYGMKTDFGDVTPLIINSFTVIPYNVINSFDSTMSVPLNSIMIGGSSNAIVKKYVETDNNLLAGPNGQLNTRNFQKTQLAVLFKFFGDFGKSLYAHIYTIFGISLNIAADGLSAGIGSLFVPGTVTSNIRYGNLLGYIHNKVREPDTEFFFRRTYIPELKLKQEVRTLFKFDEVEDFEAQIETNQIYEQLIRELCKYDHGKDCKLDELELYQERWEFCLKRYLNNCKRIRQTPTLFGFINNFRSYNENANDCRDPNEEKSISNIFRELGGVAARRASIASRRASGYFNSIFFNKEKTDFGKNPEVEYLKSFL
jgi:hypothetical protein